MAARRRGAKANFQFPGTDRWGMPEMTRVGRRTVMAVVRSGVPLSGMIWKPDLLIIVGFHASGLGTGGMPEMARVGPASIAGRVRLGRTPIGA
jgi:hypothetical protein